ncbi:M23 family metallopeptidase [Propionispora hippei]|uniref:Peptidase family M23 n=1 Tax=Propionispora hippei DSM 15287 TaxID=1123003 RepID=A0A1M6EZ27_9FIRM|nr:M23 family metallopeptidase [Propionispora hippei]SHI90682.1 Peptidase family M23 [Propionispora hippei DSM 15287]
MQLSYKTAGSRPVTHSFQKTALSICLTVLAAFCLLFGIGSLAAYQETAGPSAAIIIKKEPAATLQQRPVTQAADPSLAATPSIWPVYGTITSGFGWRSSPLESGSELHQGLDIAVGTGTPVVATADGKVVQSGWAGGYGNLVKIDHGNGLETLYGHNDKVAVTVGQEVKKGQIISYAGSTGNSTGPHVHYEIRKSGTAVDPVAYLVLY